MHNLRESVRSMRRLTVSYDIVQQPNMLASRRQRVQVLSLKKKSFPYVFTFVLTKHMHILARWCAYFVESGVTCRRQALKTSNGNSNHLSTRKTTGCHTKRLLNKRREPDTSAYTPDKRLPRRHVGVHLHPGAADVAEARVIAHNGVAHALVELRVVLLEPEILLGLRAKCSSQQCDGDRKIIQSATTPLALT